MPNGVNEQKEDREIGRCVRCTSTIPVEADRCSECGYEPGPGILGGIIMWVSGMIASVFVTIALVSIVLIFTGFPIVDGLIVFLFTGGIGTVFLGIVYAGIRAGRRGPTEQPFGGGDESITESWNDRAERGGAIADRINSIGPAIVAVLPPWTWTIGVLLGAILNLSVWIATLRESEIGMSVGIIGGIVVAFAAIVADTHRIYWSDREYTPRWWFWALLVVIPLFGWVFGLLWLLRKQQKTGSIIG